MTKSALNKCINLIYFDIQNIYRIPKAAIDE